MPNFLQFLANNAQLVLLIIIFVFPAIGAVWRWIEQQREKRRRQIELERRRLEALRTGRVEMLESPARTSVPAPATPVRTGPSREEVAARRQREMQERLRQRLEQQRTSAPPTRGSTTTTARVPTQAPAQVPGRAPTTRPPPTRVPPGSRAPTTQRPTYTGGGARGGPGGTRRPSQPDRARPIPQPQRRQPERQEAPPAQRIALSDSLQGPAVELAREEIGSAHEAAGLQASGPAVRLRPGLSVSQLREAVILREVLDRPVALREPTTDLFD